MSATKSKRFSARVLTVSDSRFTGENKDTVGPTIVEFLHKAGYETKAPVIVPDEYNSIIQALEKLLYDKKADLIITTGGTGISPRDVTPEATRAVIGYEIPGISECMRFEGSKKTEFAWLSRGIAGVRAQSIIVNVPGSERGAIQSLEAILEILPHALETVKGDSSECGKSLYYADCFDLSTWKYKEIEQLFKTVDILLKEKQLSAGDLQRRFKIGYPKACKLLETLENIGCITSKSGSTPRQLKGKKDWAKYFKKMRKKYLKDDDG